MVLNSQVLCVRLGSVHTSFAFLISIQSTREMIKISFLGSRFKHFQLERVGELVCVWF